MNKTLLSRYDQAQFIQNGFLNNILVRNDTVFPHWIESFDGASKNCFWYRRETKLGGEYRLVDVDLASNEPAFDHVELANLLRKHTKQPVDPNNLQLKSLAIRFGDRGLISQVTFLAFSKEWCFDTESLSLVEVPILAEHGTISPNGQMIAYVSKYNIWMKDLVNGEEWAITQDGVENCCYCSDLAGNSDAILLEISAVFDF